MTAYPYAIPGSRKRGGHWGGPRSSGFPLPEDPVTCLLCGGRFWRITGSHLRAHDSTLSLSVYKLRFPGEPTTCETLRLYQRDLMLDRVGGFWTREQAISAFARTTAQRRGRQPSKAWWVRRSMRPSVATIRLLFGSWNKFVLAAGGTLLYDPTAPQVERFWAKVDVRGQDECWPWTASVGKHGYGAAWDGQAVTTAHSYAYRLLVGPVPISMTLDHTCRNRRCVNVRHLEVVTRGENVLRGESPAAQNARKTHCKRGHELAGENLYVVPKTGGRRCLACVKQRKAERRDAASKRRQSCG